MHIESLSIVAEIDEHPDLSHLGEFSTDPGPEDRTIDRSERGAMGRHEKRYFVAPEWVDDPDHVEENWRRAEAYGDTWVNVGVMARAVVTIDGIYQSLRSGGVWGVESDASDDHLETLAREELGELLDVLAAIGLSPEEGRTVEWSDASYLSGPAVDV